ncbi:uncharacterized [Tachysurus ichikawai]
MGSLSHLEIVQGVLSHLKCIKGCWLRLNRIKSPLSYLESIQGLLSHSLDPHSMVFHPPRIAQESSASDVLGLIHRASHSNGIELVSEEREGSYCLV